MKNWGNTLNCLFDIQKEHSARIEVNTVFLKVVNCDPVILAGCLLPNVF